MQAILAVVNRSLKESKNLLTSHLLIEIDSKSSNRKKGLFLVVIKNSHRDEAYENIKRVPSSDTH